MNKTISKQDKLMIKLRQNSTLIQKIDNEFFDDYFTNRIVDFCSYSKNYQFHPIVQKELQFHPVNWFINYLKQTHQYKIQRQELSQKYIHQKMIELLQQNRIAPRILLSIKVINKEQILFKNKNSYLKEEIQKAFINDEYKLKEDDYIQIDEKSQLLVEDIILEILQKIEKNKDQFCNNEFFQSNDIYIIRDIYQQLSDIDIQKYPKIKQILHLYGILFKYLTQSIQSHKQEDSIRIIGSLKHLISKNLAIIALTLLVKKNIPSPNILNYVILNKIPEEEECNEKSKIIEIHFTYDFLESLLNHPEIHEFTYNLDVDQFRRTTTWKQVKQYYFNFVAHNFHEFENIQENQLLSFQLELILQNIAQTKQQIRNFIRISQLSKLFLQVEQKLNYFIQKQIKIENCDENIKEFLFIGSQLMQIKNHVFDNQNKLLPYKQRKRHLGAKRIYKFHQDLEKSDLNFKTPSLMLQSQRRKFIYLLKYFIMKQNEQNSPYLYLFSIIEWRGVSLTVRLNQETLEYLVNDRQFQKFLVDEYDIDINFGRLKERINLIIQQPYTFYLKPHIQNLKSWTTLLTYQIKQINKQKQYLSLQLKEIINTQNFIKEMDDIIERGNSCKAYEQLIENLISIKEYILNF